MDTKKTQDLQDPEKDRDELQPDKAVLNLPDVADIPGQENIHPPNLQEMADTTIASDDEEGRALFEEETEGGRLYPGDEPDAHKTVPDTPGENTEAASGNLEEAELEALEQTASPDEENLRRARLDEKDAEGDPLNEKADNSGKDLDIPGEADDDDDEDIGEEDEENNAYSLDDSE